MPTRNPPPLSGHKTWRPLPLHAHWESEPVRNKEQRRVAIECKRKVARINPKLLRLDRYDWIVLNISGGKDSLAAMWITMREAERYGVRDRVVAVHCDMQRADWPGAPEIAQRHAEQFALPYYVVRRELGDLLYQVEHQRGDWPGLSARFCTSDHKTSQVAKLVTDLCKRTRVAEGYAPRAQREAGSANEGERRRPPQRLPGPPGLHLAIWQQAIYGVPKLGNGEQHPDVGEGVTGWTGAQPGEQSLRQLDDHGVARGRSGDDRVRHVT